MQCLTQDKSENRSRQACYQPRQGEENAKPDGTNNVTGLAIGQCVKGRCFPMHCYKREQPNLTVSGLIGWIRMQGADYDLAKVIAT